MVGERPVVVIGAGPTGLAAAAELAARDLPVLVLEKGATAGAAVNEWGHVRLFSMWRDLVDPAAEKLLTATGWQRPDDEGCPTGREWIDSYLVPLADALGERVRFGSATGMSRLGRDRSWMPHAKSSPSPCGYAPRQRGADPGPCGRRCLWHLGFSQSRG